MHDPSTLYAHDPVAPPGSSMPGSVPGSVPGLAIPIGTSDPGSRNISTPSLGSGDAHGTHTHTHHPYQYQPHQAQQAVAESEAVETLTERVVGKRPGHGPGHHNAASSSSSIGIGGGDGSETKLVSNLSASDIQFLVSNQEPSPPLLEEVRDRIVKQHAFLGQRPEPANKARKPHEDPPAVDKAIRARFKPIGPEEYQARLSALRVQVDNVMEQSVVRGVVILEKRQAVWKPLSATAAPPPERIGLVQHVDRAPALPSAWLLPIDSSSHLSFTGKSKSKKTFRLPEFEAMAGCNACQATGQSLCPLCRGAEPDECFWCEGSGIRRRKTCDNCNGRKIHACLKCDASGTLPCMECKGQGQVYVGAFVELTFRTVSLPPIAVKDLIHPGTGRPPATAEEVTQCSKLKMAQTIYELSRIQSTKPSPSVPVLARCVWHKSTKRIVSVFRPAHVDVPGLKKLGLSRHKGSDPNEGETHRFLVPSDKTLKIVEISAATAATADPTHHPRTGTSNDMPAAFYADGSSSSRGTPPSAIHTPSASVANLQALWGQQVPEAVPAVPAIPASRYHSPEEGSSSQQHTYPPNPTIIS